MRRPSFQRTYELLKRLTDATSCGLVAEKTGKSLGTVEAWTRPPESLEHPTGTGRRNLFDSCLSVIGMAWECDRALAHEMAEIFGDYVVFLEKRASRKRERIEAMIGACVKEHADVIVSLLNQEEPDFEKAYTEIRESIIAQEKLAAYVKDELRCGAEAKGTK